MERIKWSLLTILATVAVVQASKVHYNLDLTWDTGAPNGVEREMIFINGRFPGPPLIMKQGDEITVGRRCIFAITDTHPSRSMWPTTFRSTHLSIFMELSESNVINELVRKLLSSI